jgi:hypothetical protein
MHSINATRHQHPASSSATLRPECNAPGITPPVGLDGSSALVAGELEIVDWTAPSVWGQKFVVVKMSRSR